MKNLVVIVRQTNVAKTFCIANCFTSSTRLHQNVPPMSPLTFAHKIVLGFISQKGKNMRKIGSSGLIYELPEHARGQESRKI